MTGANRSWKLIISADDYGYAPSYDRGIAEAAAAGLIDAASVMVLRNPDPGPLLETGIETGLHLELESGGGGRAGAGERAAAAVSIERQLDRFAELFGTAPVFLDGHHHCHARPGLGIVVCDAAERRGMVVRSVDARHRRLLRCRGIPTPDRLIGRTRESEPVLPAELRGEGEVPDGAVVEWMVHPGYPDPGTGSSYDSGRKADLDALHDLALTKGVDRMNRLFAGISPSS